MHPTFSTGWHIISRLHIHDLLQRYMFFLDMNHYIDSNKNLGVGHGNNSVFTLKKNHAVRQSKMRPNYKAQSPKQKGMHYNKYHSLPSLAHILSKSYMKV